MTRSGITAEVPQNFIALSISTTSALTFASRSRFQPAATSAQRMGWLAR
ncbi:MAG: hypothetical protein ACXW2F_03030 [Thermoanaerobaculia bacterium]